MTQNPVKCPRNIFIPTCNLILPPQSPLLKVDKYAVLTLLLLCMLATRNWPFLTMWTDFLETLPLGVNPTWLLSTKPPSPLLLAHSSPSSFFCSNHCFPETFSTRDPTSSTLPRTAATKQQKSQTPEYKTR